MCSGGMPQPSSLTVISRESSGVFWVLISRLPPLGSFQGIDEEVKHDLLDRVGMDTDSEDVLILTNKNIKFLLRKVLF